MTTWPSFRDGGIAGAYQCPAAARSSFRWSPPQLTASDLSLDLVRQEARRDGRVIELTAKEFALLEYLMRHLGRVLTRTQIVDAVWGYDLEALSNVVDIYIHYLRDKIDQGFAYPLIKTVRGVGYKIDA
jgi:DNA-binding response OmpR family regulator